MRNKCVKCLGPLVAGEFVVNKDMGYCEECAVLLHLGESKESKMFSGFQDDPEAAEAPVAPVPADLAGLILEENATEG